MGEWFFTVRLFYYYFVHTKLSLHTFELHKIMLFLQIFKTNVHETNFEVPTFLFYFCN